MNIKLRLFGELKAVADCREIEMDLPEDTSLGELLCLFETTFETNGIGLLEGDVLSRRFRVLINGRDIFIFQGIETILEDGDIVAIFPHIAGG